MSQPIMCNWCGKRHIQPAQSAAEHLSPSSTCNRAPIIVIDAYLRQDGGSLKPGKVALEYADHYRTGRARWWMAGTIIELGTPTHTELRGWSDLDDGPAMELPPLVIPAREVLRMARIEHPAEQAS